MGNMSLRIKQGVLAFMKEKCGAEGCKEKAAHVVLLCDTHFKSEL